MRAVIHYYGGVCHLVPTSMRNEMSFASNYPTLDFAQNGQNIICIMERLAKTADIKKKDRKTRERKRICFVIEPISSRVYDCNIVIYFQEQIPT